MLVLTDLSRKSLLSGATDVQALCGLTAAFPTTEVRFLPSIHAKVYVADDAEAIVTSGNMTTAGLWRNFEYGLEIKDADVVRLVSADVQGYARLGSVVAPSKLEFLAGMASDLGRLRAKAERSIEKRVAREFEARLAGFDTEVIRARAAGRSAHAIFADAILYLLTKGPLTTAQLHPLVQSIHPDLCDDTVDRVIDGKHFGKKWKHAVRTAQQHLKRMGNIRLADGVWRLREGYSGQRR